MPDISKRTERSFTYRLRYWHATETFGGSWSNAEQRSESGHGTKDYDDDILLYNDL